MTLKELVARNVSAAYRETMNAELVAKHSSDGEVPNNVVEAIREARLVLEEALTALAGAVGKKLP